MFRTRFSWASFARVGILVLVAVQNSGQTLLIKIAHTSGSRPDPTVVMLFAELVKAFVSIVLFLLLEVDSTWMSFFTPTALRRSLKLGPPALMFVVQNQLLFVAIHNLEAPVYQALNQLKIVAAGLFSVVLLGKKLGTVQWTALLLLACGAALVQLESDMCAKGSVNGVGDTRIGLIAVVVSAGTSGFSGCYTEMMLKTEPLPMWLQSAEVAFFSVAVLGVVVMWQRTAALGVGGAFPGGSPDPASELVKPLLQGFVPMTWAVVAMISLGGLCVVAALRYADNVLKGVAIVFALLISSVFSAFYLGTQLSSVFAVATTVICCSVFLYQTQAPAPAAKQAYLREDPETPSPSPSQARQSATEERP